MKKLTVALFLAAGLWAQDHADLAVVQRIKKEAFENSKVMDHLFWLTDGYGPRLTGSPGFTAAANWAVKRLREFGLDNAATQSWGKWGRSWRLTHFGLHIVEPQYAPLIAFPLAWSSSTNGPLVAEPVLAPLTITDGLDFKKSDEEIEKYFREQKGKLKGKMVLLSKPKDMKEVSEALSKPYSDADLAKEGQAPTPEALPPYDPANPVLSEKPEE